jgi:hypothetical protein
MRKRLVVPAALTVTITAFVASHSACGGDDSPSRKDASTECTVYCVQGDGDAGTCPHPDGGFAFCSDAGGCPAGCTPVA